MTNLNLLETFRTKEELINYFKEIGQNINEKEIDNLKKSYERAEETDSALTLQQLDDVAGGVIMGFIDHGTHNTNVIGNLRISFSEGDSAASIDLHRRDGKIISLKQLTQHIDIIQNGNISQTTDLSVEQNCRQLSDLLNDGNNFCVCETQNGTQQIRVYNLHTEGIDIPQGLIFYALCAYNNAAGSHISLTKSERNQQKLLNRIPITGGFGLL